MEVGKALTPEQKARELITQMLQAAGWIYREEALTGRQGGSGFADYLLFDDDGLGVALLEAKPAGTPPLSGKEQTRDYANSIGIDHVFLSNGDLHYQWFTKSGNPIRILAFPKPGELDQIRREATIDRTPLWNTPVSNTFLWTRTMRYYQVAAVKAVQEAAEAGQQRRPAGGAEVWKSSGTWSRNAWGVYRCSFSAMGMTYWGGSSSDTTSSTPSMGAGVSTIPGWEGPGASGWAGGVWVSEPETGVSGWKPGTRVAGIWNGEFDRTGGA